MTFPPLEPPEDPREASTESALAWRQSSADEHEGQRIGPYKLLGILGEGGFGTVYLAEQERPVRRRVALKVIKLGMDTKQVIARFEAERQALAMMDHSNVAKVFDAGATDLGRPFFVMEHVPGIPITEHCDLQKLTISDRLELFIQVCEAVQHAHMKGIIHRDIKPSNVLVTVRDGKAIPKVIDFGVAKATAAQLTEKTIFTEQGQLIGTPEYMSPEQAEMNAQDIDTRSDIYSLGVLLYELLTGLLPFDPTTLRRAGYAEIQRIIREDQPPKPSTKLTSSGEKGILIAGLRQMQIDALAKQLRTELEWIPLKALRKDRIERYDTPKDLANDIANYLANRPLSAGPETTAYQLRKWLRRNKLVFRSVVVILSVIVLGLIATSWGWATANQALAEANYQKYVANINAADASFANDEPGRLRTRLDECPRGLRNWEWRYLDAVSDQSLLVLSGHENDVFTARYSSSGSRIVTTSADKTARVWDIANANNPVILRGHTKLVWIADFSHENDDRVVTASWDTTARIWNSRTGQSIYELRGHQDGVLAAEFSRDDHWVVTASQDGTARVWDANSGKLERVLSGNDGPVLSAAFSEDGMRVLTASEQSIRIWDRDTGEEIYEPFETPASITHAYFNPDRTDVVLALSDGTVRTWEVAERRMSTIDGVDASSFSRATFWAHGKRTLIVSGDPIMRLSVDTTGTFSIFRGHENAISSIDVSPDDRLLVTGSWDHTARIWDASARGAGISCTHDEEVLCAEFNPDGTKIVSTDGGTARVWDSLTGEKIAEFRRNGTRFVTATFSPDGGRIALACSNGTAIIVLSDTGELGPILECHKERVSCAAFSPDGTRIVTGSSDHTVRIQSSTTGILTTPPIEIDGSIHKVGFSPDGLRIVIASSDPTQRVSLWNAQTSQQVAILSGHDDRVTQASFSPDGTQIVTSSWDKTARVWDSATGHASVTLRGHNEDVFSAAFSPDGSRIVTASKDATARVWDFAGNELAVLRGHKGAVNDVAFSHDGTRIVTASSDKTLRVWDSVPYRERFREIMALRTAHPTK